MALATCAFNFAALNTSTEVVEEQVQREPVSIPHGTWMVKEQRLADHQVDMLMWETDEGSGRCLPRMSPGSWYVSSPFLFRFCAGICKSPRFSWGWALSLSAARRRRCGKCGNARLVRVSKLAGTATIFGQDSAVGPTERHFHSELGILPILLRMLSFAAAQDQMCVSRNPRRTNTFTDCRAEPLFLSSDDLKDR
jgi:hypothetical protein